jgi:hypothetical protein
MRENVVQGVAAALECAAERGADPADSFWDDYFARSPEAAARMSHMDEHMRGRMLASVYDLLLIEDADEEQAFLDFEIGNHDAYGARTPMYVALFATLTDAVRHCCAEDWSAAWEDAWARRTERLLDVIGGVTGAT